MNKKYDRKTILAIATFALSVVFGLAFSANSYANEAAEMAWQKCGAIATDSVLYYNCAKAAVGLSGELSEQDVTHGSKLSNALGGEESRGSFSFSDALLAIKGDKDHEPSQESPTELDREAANCTKDASGWGWFACSLNKSAGVLTSFAYNKVQKYMSTDPDIFKSDTMHQAWNRFRIIADIVLVGLIFVMIISQITGLGISNYGIKKALPRIIVSVIVINLSFVLCRVAIDIANIIGDSIGAVFNGLAESAKAKINYDILADGASKTLLVGKIAGGGLFAGITAFFATKTALASGQSISLLVGGALIAAVVGILLLLTIIQVRKALIILLTITSPVAFLLYIMPGTKKLFNRWFGLFKGLLFAYPICSLLVSGGAFASAILTAALGLANEDGSVNFFTMIIAVAASVVPIFLIPKTIVQSAGAIGAKLQGLSKKLTGVLTKTMQSSRLGQRLDRGAKERANRIRAGVDRNGNETKLGRLTRSHDPRLRADAAKRAQADRALARSESNALEMAPYEDMEQQAKETEERLSNISSSKEMENEVMDIINRGAESGASAQDIAAQVAGAVKHWNKIDDKNDADGVIAGTLDNLTGENAQDIRREIARRRLADSDGVLKIKQGALRQYYRTQAATTAPTDIGATKWNGAQTGTDKNGNPIYEHNRWVEKLAGSNDFNAEWLAGVAPPQIEQLRQYMDAPNTNNDVKRQIAQVYTDMKRTSAFQTATAADYEHLERSVGRFNNTINNPNPNPNPNPNNNP